LGTPGIFPVGKNSISPFREKANPLYRKGPFLQPEEETTPGRGFKNKSAFALGKIHQTFPHKKIFRPKIPGFKKKKKAPLFLKIHRGGFLGIINKNMSGGIF